MKKLFVLLIFAAVSAFAQHGGHGGVGHSGSFGGGAPQRSMAAPHYSAPQAQRSNGWSRFGQPGYGRPMSAGRFVRPPLVIVRPGFGGYYGGYGWNYYFGMGFWPYYYSYPYNYYGPYGVNTMPAYQAQPCKKESLKDSTGAKHDILLCVQSDGSMKVVADADAMTAVPKDEVKQ